MSDFKEFYLREQLKAIKKELGDDELDDIDEVRLKLNNLDLNKETKTLTPNLDEEVQFEVAGKSYTMKQAQIVEALEKAHALAEREKSISEKEKFLNKDYTALT